jgi:O-antigen ligase
MRPDQKETEMELAPNVGSTDRLARIGVGALLIVLALTGVIGAWGWIGVVPLATGFLRFCPAYRLIGVNTCGVK